MWTPRASVAIFAALFVTVQAVKTSIYIDQISAYSKLPGCAQDQMSAIVRAQASGCGDSQQLTSFSCFCIDQSTHMVSVISTAVSSSCAMSATASITGVMPEVTSAVDVFKSYCERSTELAWYQVNSTSTVLTITTAPSSTPAIATDSAVPTAQTAESNPVPVAVIIAPVIVGVVLIGVIIGLLVWLRRRRANKHAPPTYTQSSTAYSNPPGELSGDSRLVEAATTDTAMKYRHELDNKEMNEPVELAAGGEDWKSERKVSRESMENKGAKS